MAPRSFISGVLAAAIVGAASLAFAQHASSARPSAARATPAPAHSAAGASHAPAHPAAPEPATRTNPLLPPAVNIQNFFPELTALQKLPAIIPQGFDPLYTADDWQAYRSQFGAEADGITRLKSSDVLALANKFIAAAGTESSPGLKRLLLIRAAAIVYRNKDGFPVADKAVADFEAAMDKHSAAQMGALWAITNAMSRMAVTPKPERIRYDGIAAKANMQFALLMLEVDQIEAAQTITKQIAYHEGWLKTEPTIRTQIAQVRSRVTQVTKMMDYLGTLYEPAVHNDESALLVVYLYGRYVKNNPAIVADLPGRVPGSTLAKLAASIESGTRDPAATFDAAENLRAAAATLPDIGGSLIRQRTLYAALQDYRVFVSAPQTERDRMRRLQAHMNLENVISDGARGPTTIDPFAPPATVPATQPGPQNNAEPTAVGFADVSG